MKFKVKKIRPKHKNWREKVFYHLSSVFGKNGARLFLILCPVILIFFVSAQVVHLNLFDNGEGGGGRLPKSLNVLERDENGHINILLLGTAGAMEQGGNLSDSLMVVSLDPQTQSASFLSLPRDLHIESEVGARKINEIYASGKYKYREEKDDGKIHGLRIARESIAEFLGVEIHYAAVIDFALFVDVIDILGGIDIYVPQDIVDVEYPGPNWTYETFIVRAGNQTFDGATALKYARSRHSTSDYDRARRQQDIIFALKDKATSKGILTNPAKLRNIYNLMAQNVTTNIGIAEALALGKIGVGIDYSDSLKMVLNDDPTTPGGFLFAPAREFFAGQFVLRPDSIEEMQMFIELVLIKPEILLEKAQISVQNGSKISGLANTVAGTLRRFGFNVIEVGNYDAPTPILRHKIQNLKGDEKDDVVLFLQELIGGRTEEGEEVPEKDKLDDLIDIQIILGTN